jgi:hypothetical protein
VAGTKKHPRPNQETDMPRLLKEIAAMIAS